MAMHVCKIFIIYHPNKEQSSSILFEMQGTIYKSILKVNITISCRWGFAVYTGEFPF